MASFLDKLRSVFTRKKKEKKKRKQPQKRSFLQSLRRKSLEVGAAIQKPTESIIRKGIIKPVERSTFAARLQEKLPEPVRTPKKVRKSVATFRRTISKGMGEEKTSFRSMLTRGALEAGAAVQRRIPKSVDIKGRISTPLPEQMKAAAELTLPARKEFAARARELKPKLRVGTEKVAKAVGKLPGGFVPEQLVKFLGGELQYAAGMLERGMVPTETLKEFKKGDFLKRVEIGAELTYPLAVLPIGEGAKAGVGITTKTFTNVSALLKNPAVKKALVSEVGAVRFDFKIGNKWLRNLNKAEVQNWGKYAQSKKLPYEIKALLTSEKGSIKLFRRTAKPKLKKIETIKNPVERLIQATRGLKSKRLQQEALYSEELSKRFAKTRAIGGRLEGEAGFRKKLGVMTGELPKVEYESMRKYFKKEDIDFYFNKVEKAKFLTEGQKLTGQKALSNLLGAPGATLPTRGELETLHKVFPKEFVEAVLANRPAMEKVISGLIETGNLPRTLMATADYSGTLRQSAYMAPSHPIIWGKSVLKQAQVSFSTKEFQKLQTQVRENPNYLFSQDFARPLALTEVGGKFAKREESFMAGELGKKIPVFGKVVAFSERAYVGLLNKFRMDLFSKFVKDAEKLGLKNNKKYMQDMIDIVNNGTGRGTHKILKDDIAVASNALFFSPRLQAARISLLNPTYYIRMHPQARKEALKNLAAFASTGTLILALAKKTNVAEIGLDSNSADFGKVKIGNTRFDFWGGLQQYVKLISQLTSGQIVSSTTGKKMYLGEGFRALDRLDILVRFAEYKTSPIASLIIDLFRGKTGLGENLTFSNTVLTRVIPLMAQDTLEVLEDTGELGVKTGLSGLAAFSGLNIQTYGKYPSKEGKTASKILAELKALDSEEEKDALWDKYDKQGLLSSKVVNTIEKIIEDENKEVAQYVVDTLKGAKTEEEKDSLWDKFQSDGVLTERVEEAVRAIVGEKTLGIEEGLKDRPVDVRAKYIRGKLAELDSEEEKDALWEQFEEQGIATKAVAEEIDRLIKESKYKKTQPSLLQQFRNLPLVP